ncbi:MAG: mechanosensitive ion channel [Lachnospiraceae bacterium]|nr:mechanosensitive ion channel [Lachnospiraceae bacterium]
MAFLQMFPAEVAAVIKAFLLLILAYIVAGIVRGLILKLIDKTGIKGWLDKSNQGDQLRGYIGKLVYLLVFLLFVPGIFTLLGISQVADPLLRLLSQIWGYVPNILAAIIVLLVGTLIAKLVRQLLVPVFVKFGLDKLQEKAGLETDEESRLSVTAAYVVYVLILIPVIVVSLQALGIEAIASPAISMLSTIFIFIPNIAVAVLVIILGVILAKLARNIIRQMLSSSGIDIKLQKLLGEKGRGFVLSKVVSEVVRVVIVIFFVVEGLNVLHLSVMTKFGASLIDYMPSVLAALLILLAAVLGADAAENALKKSGLTGFALIVRITIMTVAVFMILSQLGIAEEIVTKAFLIIVAALAVSFAVAFGVGGREFAKKQLDKLDQKIEDAKEKESEAETGADAKAQKEE